MIFWKKIVSEGYEILEISDDLAESYNQWIAEEGEAAVVTTDNIEPKKEPVIRKGGPKKWVKIGKKPKKGYANYGINPDANLSGESNE